MSINQLLLFTGMCTAILACQQPTAPLKPSYEGQYSLQVTSQLQFDTTPVTETGKGTLTVLKNADGTYTFTENLPVTNRSYQVSLTGTTFELPVETESSPVNGVSYSFESRGSGEFKTNSVTITRTSAFDAGSVRVNRTITSYGYR